MNPVDLVHPDFQDLQVVLPVHCFQLVQQGRTLRFFQYLATLLDLQLYKHFYVFNVLCV